MRNRPFTAYHVHRLSRTLTKLRRTARLTQEEIEERLRIDSKKLSRIENGQRPTFVELQALLDLYGLTPDEQAPCTELWELAGKEFWWDRLGHPDRVYLSFEHEAVGIKDFQTAHLPVFLQTSSYRQPLLATEVRPPGKHRTDMEVLAHRQRRKTVMERATALHLLIYEPALHPGLDRAQLSQILTTAEQDNVTVQLVREPHLPHLTMRSSFTLLTFADADEPDLVRGQDSLGLHHTQDPATVAEVRLRFKTLLTYAESPDDTREYLARRVAAGADTATPAPGGR